MITVIFGSAVEEHTHTHTHTHTELENCLCQRKKKTRFSWKKWLLVLLRKYLKLQFTFFFH